MTLSYVFPPPEIVAVPIVNSEQLFPIHRLFFVGRNYQAHAAEMGVSIDKASAKPFYFTKSSTALVQSGAHIPYALATQNLHYEMELVVAIGQAGVNLACAEAQSHIFGYACGLDMTRRDLQGEAKKKALPWDCGKDFADSAVISPIVKMPGQLLDQANIELSVNGQIKQRSNIAQMIWNVQELIADLSTYYPLKAGDLIYTGTPDGVGPVVSGDRITGAIEGIGTIALDIA